MDTANRVYSFDMPARRRIAGKHLHRVLFASGSAEGIEPCQRMLRSRGVDVQLVHDGRSCVEEALQGKKAGTPFDIIVLSVDLPVLDGFSTAMLLRENDCARLIISMHGNEHYLVEEESRGAGCNFHSKEEKILSDIESLLAAA